METPVPNDELLDVEGVAALLSVHRNTVRRLYNKDGLPTIHIGRVIRFRRTDVEQWLADRVEAKTASA